jgi:hypothetical protein
MICFRDSAHSLGGGVTATVAVIAVSPTLHPPLLFYFILRYWGLNSGPSPRATPPALAVMGISEIGDHELFAWADFKSQSS